MSRRHFNAVLVPFFKPEIRFPCVLRTCLVHRFSQSKVVLGVIHQGWRQDSSDGGLMPPTGGGLTILVPEP